MFLCFVFFGVFVGYSVFVAVHIKCFVVFPVGPKVLTYVTKVMVQSLQLLHVLLKMELQSHILMQVCLILIEEEYQ